MSVREEITATLMLIALTHLDLTYASVKLAMMGMELTAQV